MKMKMERKERRGEKNERRQRKKERYLDKILVGYISSREFECPGVTPKMNKNNSVIHKMAE